MIRGSWWDLVHATTPSADVIHQLIEASIVADPARRRIDVRSRSEELVEQGISGPLIEGSVLRDPAPEQQLAGKSRTGCGSRCLPRMVRLNRPNAGEGVGVLGNSVGEEELEFARLVATAGESRQIVALHPDLCPSQALRQAGQRVERGREGGQLDPRERF